MVGHLCLPQAILTPAFFILSFGIWIFLFFNFYLVQMHIIIGIFLESVYVKVYVTYQHQPLCPFLAELRKKILQLAYVGTLIS